jgi:arsenate reductase
MSNYNSMLYPDISLYIDELNTNTISEERKKTLQPLVDFIQEKTTKKEKIRLNFICTHNSRRSHLGQIWACTMAYYFNINNVATYSGGTEATALYPKISEILKNSGFNIESISEFNNPIYAIKFGENSQPIIGFSKNFDANFNPKSDFVAIMTCSSADVGCPFIPGASLRIPITYEDPKTFDNSPLQDEKYSERSKQIATELKYVFALIQ